MAGTKYSNCSTLIVGCFLYNEPALLTTVADGFYSDGANQMTVVSGEITAISECSPPLPSGNARYASTSGGVCAASPSMVYLTGTFGTGIAVYTNAGLSMPLLGFDFISFEDGEIYEINPSNGVVGIGTGNLC